jgi:chromate reductase
MTGLALYAIAAALIAYFGVNAYTGKPVGIVANSPGALGGVCAAMHLKSILPGISGPIMQQPEIYLNGVGDAFDDKGNLTKEALEKVLKDYIAAFAAWIERLKT